MDLDFMPSPVPDRPGLLIRDPHQYSDTTLIIPPPLVESLRHFDGEATDLDLRAHLARLSGSLEVGGVVGHLIKTLSGAGFLEDDVFFGLRDRKHQEFAAAAVRAPVHAGAGYPDTPERLREVFEGYFRQIDGDFSRDAVRAIAAPHVSPEGGWKMYASAYRAAPEAAGDRVFVILGTSHYGQPDRFGLTRKPFATPYGVARTATNLVDRLAHAAPGAVEMEDYCHSVEHSIEFQVVFLQHLFGPEIRILPILCGSFARSILTGGMPEDNEEVRRFLEALGELAAAEGSRLFWVLGVDMAHMGRRYGDTFAARAGQGVMGQVSGEDRERIRRLEEGDAAGFWELVRRRENDLKWCGSSAFYTLLRTLPGCRGSLLGYEQWNIDRESVVTFGAMAFRQE
jgi:hypothetical protein